MRGKPRGLLLILCLAHAAVEAGPGNTWQDEFRVYTADLATQCAAVKQQLSEFKMRANPLGGFTLKDAVQSLCVCLPEKTQALKDTFSPGELAREIAAEEFLARFNPAVIHKCTAEQMMAMYGDDCRKRFKQAGLNERKYCACMKSVVSGYSEAMTAAIAADASEYLPLASEMEQRNEPAPARPPALEAYYQADQRCKAE
jgi:hypothetical protein